MIIISKMLYFVSHHGFYTVLILILFFGLLAYLTKKTWLIILVIPLGILNVICGQYLNAWFLNKFGTESTAVITSDEETNSTLNDRYIHDYEAIVKKPDGKYIKTFFSTTTAAIYPIENAIRIPAMNTTFPVKYIPGYEKNIVILSALSEEGKMRLKYEKQKLVDKAIIQYEADSTNKDFIREYISAMENYMKDYDDSDYTGKISDLEKKLNDVKE